MRLRYLLVVLVVVCALAVTADRPQPVASTLVCTTSGTVTAALQVGGEFDGLYKYTISASWDTGGEGLSHISFLITYSCDCCNIAGLTAFDSIAGTSTGEDENGSPCTAHYIGLGDLCTDDPTVGGGKPAIKFEQIETACEAVQVGSGTFCFYSVLPPLPVDTYTDAVAVKYGNNTCLGDLTGQMPDCTNCLTVPTQFKTWGEIKADYEKK